MRRHSAGQQAERLLVRVDAEGMAQQVAVLGLRDCCEAVWNLVPKRLQLAVLGTGRTVPIWPAARHLSAAKWSTAAAEGTKPWCVGYCVAVGRARRDDRKPHKINKENFVFPI